MGIELKTNRQSELVHVLYTLPTNNVMHKSRPKKKESLKEMMINYHGKCTKSAMDNKIGHVTDNISSEANVEKHVEHVESLLTGINRVQITVTHGG